MSDKYAPEELHEQDHSIIEQLERMYGTQAPDVQSLARIRARIVQNNAGPLPFPQSTRNDKPARTPSRNRRAKEANMRFIYRAVEKPWQRRLSMIAATFFILILVGSLVLLLVRRSSNTTVEGLQPLQPGWTQVALLSGSSSKTFTHQNIALSTLWGISYGCVGQGKLDIEFDAQTHYAASGECPMNTGPAISGPYGPQSIDLETTGHTIQTIKVTVSGSINWFLQFSNAQVTPAPLLSRLLAPGSGWQEQLGMGGRGNFSGDLPSQGVTLPNGKTIHPGVWGIVVVCSGTDKIHISLDPPIKGVQIPAPVCNEQPVFDILRVSSYESVNLFTDSPPYASKTVLQAYILACTDEHACLKNH